MHQQANIIVEQNRLLVSGDLTFNTAMKLWEKSLLIFAERDELHFDLSEVGSTNSGGLALLLEWVKQAKKMDKKIRFSNLPAQLVSIASAASVEKLLFKN